MALPCVRPQCARESFVIKVGQVFEQHEILLTGGNGFLGKVVLGLLLDRFPGLKHLHVLLRPQRDLSAQERFAREILDSPALAPVIEKRGRNAVREKITVWSGDIGKPLCGLESESLEQLTGRVGLILNCAGKVDFFPPVDDSFRSNVDGINHLAEVARRIRAKLLHVSTCYVCGEGDGLIEETDPILGFYPRRMNPQEGTFSHTTEIQTCRKLVRQVYESVGSNGDAPGGARSRKITERLSDLGRKRAERWGWVNTYTYAKSLGEQVLAAQENLEWAIVRPAIIESALRFPFPGWIEGGRTSAPLVLMALGGLKDWPVKKDAPLEVVPVDLVASAILAVGALLLEGNHRPVYQLGTADVNPLWMEPLVKLLDRESHQQRKRRGKVRFLTPEEARARRIRLQNRIARTRALLGRMQGALEALGLDGEKTFSRWSSALRVRELQAAFREQTLDQYLPFVLHNRYIFESENIRTAYSMISADERALIPWDPEKINWTDYWTHNQIPGIEKWVQPDVVKDWSFKI